MNDNESGVKDLYAIIESVCNNY